MSALHALAEAVGLAPRWQNYRHEWQQVGDNSLRTILKSLGFPADTDNQLAESRAALAEERGDLAPLVTAIVNLPTRLPIEPGPFELRFEDGSTRSGMLEASAGGATLPSIEIAGYHTLEAGGRQAILAVARNTD